MKVHTDYLWFNTKKRQEFIRITDDVAAIVTASGVTEGTVLVLGPWEQVFYAKFDGQRKKRVVVKVMGL